MLPVRRKTSDLIASWVGLLLAVLLRTPADADLQTAGV